VFPDQFAPNCALFVLGLVAAIGFLRTGMLARGGLLLVILLVAMDAALVVRFVYDRTDAAYLISLAVMQVTAFSAFGWWVLQWGLRRWSADRSQWEQLFADATRHYMRNELSAAEQLFLRLRRVNPWDPASAIGLANVQWRSGRPKIARRLLRAARSLDRSGAYANLIGEQLRRLG
jgi:hypothetical protein